MNVIPLFAIGFFPLIDTLFPFKAFLKDQKALSSAKRLQIENRVQKLCDKLGVKKKVEIIEREGIIAHTFGNSLLPGKAGIIIDPNVFER